MREVWPPGTRVSIQWKRLRWSRSKPAWLKLLYRVGNGAEVRSFLTAFQTGLKSRFSWAVV